MAQRRRRHRLAVRRDPTYLLTGWSCRLLMALGLLCLVPPAVADRRDRERRFYRRGTGAWYGRGITLYLLGFGWRPTWRRSQTG